MNMDLQAIIDIVKNIDWTILHLIQNNLRMDILDQIFPIITRLGDMGAVWIVLSLILLIPRRTRRTAVLMLIGMAASLADITEYNGRKEIK